MTSSSPSALGSTFGSFLISRGSCSSSSSPLLKSEDCFDVDARGALLGGREYWLDAGRLDGPATGAGLSFTMALPPIWS